MLSKYLKHRRAVSPVVATVLLIALTVAAAAVIWNSIPETNTNSLYIDVQDVNNLNSTHLEIVLILDASNQMSVVDFAFLQTPGSVTVTNIRFNGLTTVVINSGGANIITVTLIAQNGAWISGNYNFALSWQISGSSTELSTSTFALI